MKERHTSTVKVMLAVMVGLTFSSLGLSLLTFRAYLDLDKRWQATEVLVHQNVTKQTRFNIAVTDYLVSKKNNHE